MTKEELEKENSELKEELKKWKDEWQEQVQKATDEGFARTLQTNQLSKAKEIIKTFLGFAEAFGYSPSMDKFIAEAEQFLKDSEVKQYANNFYYFSNHFCYMDFIALSEVEK